MRPPEDECVSGEGARSKQQRDFVERGLTARGEARRTNEYFIAEAVHAELHRMLVKNLRKTNP